MAAPPHNSPPSDTEVRLLDAAEVVFAERGFNAATTAAIADEAGVNKTQIHYYFRSKEGLYRAMMDRISQRHVVFLDDLSHDDPVEALTQATHRFVRFLADSPHYVRLCAYSALEGTEHGDEELLQKLMEAAINAIQRGVDQGRFRPEDPRHVLMSIEGMVRFFFEHEEKALEMWGPEVNRDAIIEERAEHVVRMLLMGLGATPSSNNRTKPDAPASQIEGTERGGSGQ